MKKTREAERIPAGENVAGDLQVSNIIDSPSTPPEAGRLPANVPSFAHLTQLIQLAQQFFNLQLVGWLSVDPSEANSSPLVHHENGGIK